MLRPLLAAALAGCAAAAAPPAVITLRGGAAALTVDPATAEVNISRGAGGEVLLRSVGVGAFTGGAWRGSGGEGLALLRHRQTRVAGAYEEVAMDWGGGAAPLTTSVRLSADGRSAVFAVRFPEGAAGTAAMGHRNCALLGAMGVCPSWPSTRFPSFDTSVGLLSSGSAGYWTWQQNMCRPSMGAAAELTVHGIEGGPVVLHDLADSGMRAAVVVSHLNQFLTATQNVSERSGGRWDIGVGGEITTLPKGFEQQTVVFIGGQEDGVLETVYGWGELLRKAHGTDKAAVRAADPTLSQLS